MQGDQRIVLEFRKMQLVIAGQLMPSGDDETELLSCDGDRLEGRVIRLTDKGKVEVPGFQGLDELVLQLLHIGKMQRAAAGLAGEGLRDLWDQRSRKAVHIAERYRGSCVTFQLVHRFRGKPDFFQSSVDMAVKGLAVICQRQMAVPAFEKRDTELFFQLMDGIAEAGLGNMQFFCGARVVERPCKTAEILELGQVHGNPSLDHGKKQYGRNTESLGVNPSYPSAGMCARPPLSPFRDIRGLPDRIKS